MLARAGHFVEASLCYRQVLLNDQLNVSLYLELGELLARAARPDEQIALYDQALKRGCNSAKIYNNLGNAFYAMARHEEAVAALREAVRLEPSYALAWYNLGAPLIAVGDEVAAEAAYRRALKITPDNPDAMFNLAGLLQHQGRRPEWEALLRRLLLLHPAYSRAHLQLACGIRHREHDDDIHAMEKLYAQPALSCEQREHLAFGLGKSFEDLGDYDQAFAYFAEANRLHRAAIRFSSADSAAVFSRLPSVFSREFLAGFKPIATRGPFRPLFILGMPRSGTSLVEQILASHSQVFGAGELAELGAVLAERLGAIDSFDYPAKVAKLTSAVLADMATRYFEGVSRRLGIAAAGATVVTDKMPHNFLHLGLIPLLFPEAKVVHCRRHPLDNCLSIFKNLFIDGHNYAYELSELGGYYRQYHELMAHWRLVLPGVILDLSYEDLVAKPEEEIRRLLAFCQLPWDDQCREFYLTRRTVSTLSANQVRDPLYGNSVGVWQKYGNHLAPLTKALGDLAVERPIRG